MAKIYDVVEKVEVLEIPMGLKADFARFRKNFPDRQAKENNIDFLPLIV